jgi:hypothetical protein
VGKPVAGHTKDRKGAIAPSFAVAQRQKVLCMGLFFRNWGPLKKAREPETEKRAAKLARLHRAPDAFMLDRHKTTPRRSAGG